jgi:hypothetical protein
MLVFLKRGQKQHMHTAEESYSSRSVTKIRWVVESVNGKLKFWKFRHDISEILLKVALNAIKQTNNIIFTYVGNLAIWYNIGQKRGVKHHKRNQP